MLVFRSGFWLLGALLSFTSTVYSVEVDPDKDFCSLSGHMMAQKDGRLYIIGGLMLYTWPYEDYSGGSLYPLRMPYIPHLPQINYSTTRLDPVLRSLDVSKSFRTSADNTNYFRREEIRESIPGVEGAAFFPTESGFDLTFGRWHPYNNSTYGKRDPPIENRKSHYDIKTQRWRDTEITLKNWFQPNSQRRIGSSMTVWIESLKKGFLFGGLHVSVNETLWDADKLEENNGLITYDQATNTWTNESTPLGGISAGGLVHITTATDEVLIQIGGRSDLATKSRPFSDVNIYSTKKSKWYTQHLSSASVPTPRSAFCTAVKSASDGSSCQIYIMGGLEASYLPEGKTSDLDSSGEVEGTTPSIWVLSIPSLEWAELPVKLGGTVMNPNGRISPKCSAIGEHYIFYYGGRYPQNYYPHTCDKRANAAFLFDINTLEWTDEFKANEGTYQIPQEVTKLIGGGKSGGSTKNGPTGGWSDPDLEIIMTMARNSTTGRTTDSSKPNIGEIVGGSVAGVVAMALGLWGAIVLRRRRQRRRSQPPPNPNTPPTTGAGTAPEGGSPAELMVHNKVNGGIVNPTELPSGWAASEMDPAELPSGEVASEMDPGH